MQGAASGDSLTKGRDARARLPDRGGRGDSASRHRFARRGGQSVHGRQADVGGARDSDVSGLGQAPRSGRPRPPQLQGGRRRTGRLRESPRGLLEAARRRELQRADTFLKNRAFDRLQAAFGITPGTLNHTRWEIIVKTAQTSKTPTAELLSVCVAGAETLKYTMSTVTLGTPASMLRRASTTWFSVLSHGALVSDALDSLVR